MPARPRRRPIWIRLTVASVAALLLPALAPADAHAQAPDPYRPTYHYSPVQNFMNDPNGLIHHQGVYHLFFQYNPTGATAGNGSWGHATSTDLVHWKDQPLAIPTDASEDVWSGSVVFDRTNTSGLGTRRNPPLVAAYTSFHKPDGIQRQSLAYSRDNGRTWTKYAQNPVIDIGSKDFRDPKVFWDAQRGRWAMAVALAAEKKVSVYTSPDLKTWTHRSDFGPAGVSSSVWECPDLFPLMLHGKQKWVLSLSVAGKTQYFVGDFDGATFTSPDAAYTPPAPARVLGDFEGSDYEGWTTTGTAFGTGPVVPGADVTGKHGAQVVDSFGGSDGAQGTLTSPAFTVDHRYLNFLLAGGNHPYDPDGADGPPPGTVFADFEGDDYGAGWTATGDLAGTGPSASDVPGKVGRRVLDTCVKTCDPATGTVRSPDFTVGSDYVNLLVGGGDHPLGGPEPTAVSLVVDGEVMATAQGRNSPDLVWTAWDTSALRGRTAHLEVTDQRTADWGHLIVDQIMFSDQPAKPVNRATAANLIVDGEVVRTATGAGGPGLDWVSWDLADLQGKTAQVQFVDTATSDWGHLIADYVALADAPALSAARRARWIDHGNDYYAAVTWNDAPRDQRLMIGWMSNWDYAQQTPTGAWRGQQSVVRRLELADVRGRPTLVHRPAGLETLVARTTRTAPFTVTGRRTLSTGGTALRIRATIDPRSATDAGIAVRVGRGQQTRVGYDRASGSVYVDRTASGTSGFSDRFAGVHRAPLDLAGRPLELKVLVDASSVEVFANGGRVAISDLIYPDASSRGVAVYSAGGPARVDRLEVSTLRPSIRR